MTFASRKKSGPIAAATIRHDLNKGAHADASETYSIIGAVGKLNSSRENDLSSRGDVNSYSWTCQRSRMDLNEY